VAGVPRSFTLLVTPLWCGIVFGRLRLFAMMLVTLFPCLSASSVTGKLQCVTAVLLKLPE